MRFYAKTRRDLLGYARAIRLGMARRRLDEAFELDEALKIAECCDRAALRDAQQRMVEIRQWPRDGIAQQQRI